MYSYICNGSANVDQRAKSMCLYIFHLYITFHNSNVTCKYIHVWSRVTTSRGVASWDCSTSLEVASVIRESEYQYEYIKNRVTPRVQVARFQRYVANAHGFPTIPYFKVSGGGLIYLSLVPSQAQSANAHSLPRIPLGQAPRAGIAWS